MVVEVAKTTPTIDTDLHSLTIYFGGLRLMKTFTIIKLNYTKLCHESCTWEEKESGWKDFVWVIKINQCVDIFCPWLHE